MTEFLDRDDVLTAGAVAVGHVLEVSDYGLLDAAVARPRATIFEIDAYEGTFAKAAAFLQSLARNYALIDGSKRTAWAATWVFLHLNGHELAPGYDVDSAEATMNEVATQGELAIETIASALKAFATVPDAQSRRGGLFASGAPIARDAEAHLPGFGTS